MRDPVLVTLFPAHNDFTEREVVDWAQVYRARRRTKGDVYTELYFRGVELPLKVLESIEDLIFGVDGPEAESSTHDFGNDALDDLTLEEVRPEAAEDETSSQRNPSTRSSPKRVSKENS